MATYYPLAATAPAASGIFTNPTPVLHNAATLLDSHSFNVLAFGAAGDGTTDDLPAFNAAAAAALAAGGGTIYIPRPTKAYRLTGQWLYGYKFVNEADINVGTNDYTAAPSYNSTQSALALTAPMCRIQAQPGAAIWCDYAPVVETAALYVGVRSSSNNLNAVHMEVNGLLIYAQAGMTAGVPNIIGEPAPVPGSQIGIFSAGNTIKIRDCSIRECKRAIVLDSCYEAEVSSTFVWRCVDGIHLNGCNGSRVRFNTVWYAHGNGMIVRAQGSDIHTFIGQDCATSVWMQETDNVSWTGAYLEDLTGVNSGWEVQFGIRQWVTGKAYSAGVAGSSNPDYVNNGGNTYKCIVSGTSSSAPTGTGTNIPDGATLRWAYVGTNRGNAQCLYTEVANVHMSKTGGKHFLLCGSSILFNMCRPYVTGATSKSYLEDTGSSARFLGPQFPIDAASPGANNLLVLDENTIQSQGGLYMGASQADLTGAKTSGLQMASEWIWYDSTGGMMRWKHNTPASQADGNTMAPVGNTVSWASFPSTAAGAAASTTTAWTGIAGDALVATPVSQAGTWPAGVLLYAYFSANNVVTVVCFNGSGATFNPGSFTYQLSLWQVRH